MSGHSYSTPIKLLIDITLFSHYSRNWNIELEKASRENAQKVRPSLFRAVVATFGLEFMFHGLLLFIEECGAKYCNLVLLDSSPKKSDFYLLIFIGSLSHCVLEC